MYTVYVIIISQFFLCTDLIFQFFVAPTFHIAFHLIQQRCNSDLHRSEDVHHGEGGAFVIYGYG